MNLFDSIDATGYFLFHSGHYAALTLAFVGVSLVLFFTLFGIDEYVNGDLYFIKKRRRSLPAIVALTLVVVSLLFLRAWTLPSFFNPPDPNREFMFHMRR